MNNLKIPILILLAVAIYSNATAIRNEKELADTIHLERQNSILSNLIGILYPKYLPEEEFNLLENANKFHKPDLLKMFNEEYNNGLLPLKASFSSYAKRTRKQIALLFNIMYSAKDFDTFHQFAKWTKKHVNPIEFGFAFLLTVHHREDCSDFLLPPLFEIVSNYFVPIETQHELFEAVMFGEKEKLILYNNTGYEFLYEDTVDGTTFGSGGLEDTEHHISYFREDVNLNAWFTNLMFNYPTWFNPELFNKTSNYKKVWFNRGEHYYYLLHQLYAIYALQRLANGMSAVEPLDWDEPINVGYNPRVTQFNGKPFSTRPDNAIPIAFNRKAFYQLKIKEYQIMNYLHERKLLAINIDDSDATDSLAKVIFGMPNDYNKMLLGDYISESMIALGYLPKLSIQNDFVGAAMSSPATMLRDPAFYQYIKRLLNIFYKYKNTLPPYTREQLNFEGVTVKDFEIDTLTTYFECYDYEINSLVPMKDIKTYFNHKYSARQFRFNHKPYNYKIKIDSTVANDSMIRVFIGPKFDTDERLFTLSQSSRIFVELDRFQVKLRPGENVFERNSKESPLFSQDPELFRSIYQRVEDGIKNSKPYYINERISTGLPERFQLPRGSKSGLKYVISVIVTPYEQAYKGKSKNFNAPFGSDKVYDKRSLGFPFDRQIDNNNINVPNIIFKDVIIFHKDEYDSTD